MNKSDPFDMDTRLRRAIEPELESGERVLWAARPSLRHYVLRRLPMMLIFGVAMIWIALTQREGIMAAIETQGEHVACILGGMAVLPLLVALAAIRVRRRTIYAITDRRLIRAGGRTWLGNRPGQDFAYRPDEIRILEISSIGPWQHVYVDRKRWGSNDRTVLIGFDNVRDAEAVRDRIRAWLDDYQKRLLSGTTDRRAVISDDYGFRLEVPAAWTIEVGTGDDSDPAGASPAEWEQELSAWNGESRGWNRLRVTGPVDSTLAIEALRAPGQRTDDELDPMVEGALKHFFGMDRETTEIEFWGVPATLIAWSTLEMEFRMVTVPRGDLEYRIHLISRSTMSRLMEELQTIVESLRVREPEAESRVAPG